MRLTKKGKGVRFLSNEYGSFRQGIIEYFEKSVVTECRLLLDPMCGSCPLIPTVEKNNIVAHFNDIIPVHYYVNKIKTYKAFLGFTKSNKDRTDTIYYEAIDCLRGLKNKRLIVSDKWIEDSILEALIEAWKKAGSHPRTVSDILKAIVVLSIRPYSCFTRSKKNGTWLKAGGVTTGSPLSEIVRGILAKFSKFYSLNYPPSEKLGHGKFFFTCEDAALLSKKTKVDVIFTSPPYCNRFEPEVTYAPELFFFRAVQKAIGPDRIIGTTKVNDYPSTSEDLDFIHEVAPKTLEFLRGVKKTEIKRECNYYSRYYIRYYSKLYKVLENILSLVKRGGNIYIAVQDNIHRGNLNNTNLYISNFFRRQGCDVYTAYKNLEHHQGLRNISKNHPLVIKRHWEHVIRATKC
jgi:hypothetical protein